MLRHAPTRVRRAFVFLWVSFAIALSEAIASEVIAALAGEEVFALMWAFLALAFGAGAYFIYSASLRKNWARLILLAITTMSVLGNVVWASDWIEQPWWSATTFVVCVVMELVALYWLFTEEGTQWYRAQAA